MQLIDFEDRLVAIDSKATRGYVLLSETKRWGEIGADFARKAWLEGEEITPDMARQRFEGAKLDELPLQEG